MGFKIIKYGGKHKIKDTKTGKAVEIDIAKYMDGGKDKKKDLSKAQVKDIVDSTGVEFTEQGANALFETVDPAMARPNTPEFNLGKYKDVGYFNVNYTGNQFNISPTKNNPGNYAKYKEYLKYLQKQNPDVKINNRPNENGYLDFSKRLEYGGTIDDLVMFMAGGGEKGKDKKLSSSQVEDIVDSTGVEFTEEGANSLFETVDPATVPSIPEFNLGKYKDVGYFNVGYSNGEFSVSPTKRNPGNYDKYKEYLDYLQEQNPDVKLNRRDNNNGFIPLGNRLEYGGKMITVPKYALGTEFDCPPGDVECQKQKSQGTGNGYGNSELGLQKDRYNFLLNANNQNTAKGSPFYDEQDFTGNPNFDVNPNSTSGNNYGPSELGLQKDRYNFLLNANNQNTAKGSPFYDESDWNSGTPAENASTDSGAPASTTGTPATNLDEARTQGDPFTPTNDISGEAGTELVSNGNYGNAPREEQDFSIANPYGGVDIPSAANYLGSSIENKDGLGIAASSLKIAAGLGRNIVSGLGSQNRYNQVMENYYKDQRNNRNPIQYQENGGKMDYFAYGGKKDSELATGEYMRGIENEETEDFNAEIEKGEYFQTNEGDISEVVGDKHSQGGEKIQMQPEDRVLSDKLKLGGKKAKELSNKYGLNLKAKDTYSTVLDKYKRKSKLNKIIKEEAEILEKINDQDKVDDATTKNFNLEVLAEKQREIAERKHPIEEQRKEMFEELFNIQEESKTGKNGNKFDEGGKKEDESLKVGDIDPVTGKKVTKEVAKQKVESGEWEALGGDRYVKRGVEGSTSASSEAMQSYRQTWDKEKFPKFEDYVKAAEEWKAANPNWRQNKVQVTPGTPDQHFYTRDPKVTVSQPYGIDVDNTLKGEVQGRVYEPEAPEHELIMPSERALAGAYLFPDETPLPPSSLQGTIKPERRFDRVSPTEIDVEAYLQDTRDREAAQIQSLEGLSPNVRAAVLANMRANSQSQESNIRNQIDTQNMNSQEKAIYTNANIQAREENASEADRLAYEQRQYRAQALTDNDNNNYYNQLQSLNKQKFMDIHNLNLINATNEDVYFDGQKYRRKNSDQDILRRIKV